MRASQYYYCIFLYLFIIIFRFFDDDDDDGDDDRAADINARKSGGVIRPRHPIPIPTPIRLYYNIIIIMMCTTRNAKITITISSHVCLHNI